MCSQLLGSGRIAVLCQEADFSSRGRARSQGALCAGVGQLRSASSGVRSPVCFCCPGAPFSAFAQGAHLPAGRLPRGSACVAAEGFGGVSWRCFCRRSFRPALFSERGKAQALIPPERLRASRLPRSKYGAVLTSCPERSPGPAPEAASLWPRRAAPPRTACR